MNLYRVGRIIAVLLAVITTIISIYVHCNTVGCCKGIYIGYLVLYLIIFFVSFFSDLRILALIGLVILNFWYLAKSSSSWCLSPPHENIITFCVICSLLSGIIPMVFRKRYAKENNNSTYSSSSSSYSSPSLTAYNIAELIQNGESCATCENRYGDCPYEGRQLPSANGTNICHKHSKM